MNGKCLLCSKNRTLILSHIIAKFVFAYLKESAPSAIRTVSVPNQRVQDGIKDYLLCGECEQLFGTWEKAFSECIFLPLHDPSPMTSPIRYESWAIKFAVSVSWRVLHHYLETASSEFTEKQMEYTRRAFTAWRSFLLEKQKHPGEFEQHLLLLDTVENHTASDTSPFLNRYFLRTIHMDLLTTDTSIMIYTKMCRIIIFGFIRQNNSNRWKGTKLHINHGTIVPRTRYIIPAGLAAYFNEKADEAKAALNSLSPNQERKVENAIKQNLDGIANSEIFRAIASDFAQSGTKAFKEQKKR
ncbi:MAG: hypothetical protein HZB59_02915 [Ignavibacteriales bacterium]|nr:hypothetical protein [Ignavibacteriales bacterium]